MLAVFWAALRAKYYCPSELFFTTIKDDNVSYFGFWHLALRL